MEQIEVLMATYNGERYVAQQIDSLLKQSFQSFRLVIRDDGSTDNTREVIGAYADRYPGRISVHPDHHNLGVIGNFSTLLEKSQAPYAMLCDQDDVWLPRKIADSLQAFKQLEAHYGADTPLLLHTDLVVVDESLAVIAPSFLTQSRLQTGHDFGRLLVKNNVTGCTAVLNRALIRRAVPIPPESLMHDWWLALVGAAFGQVAYMPGREILYRQHAGNVAGQINYNWAYISRSFGAGWRANRRRGILRTIKQAQLFRDRYYSHLPANYRKILDAFISVENENFFTKRINLLRYGLRDASFVRTLGMLLAV